MVTRLHSGMLSSDMSPPRDGERYRTVFAACDEGRKGYLSREDFKVAVVMLFGYKPCKMEVDSMLSFKSGGIREDEFVKMMSVKRSAQLNFGEQRQIFSVFDTYLGRGLPDMVTLLLGTTDARTPLDCGARDFKRAFKRVAPNIPEHTVLAAFREVDRDSDGLVSYKDFEFAMDYGGTAD